MTAEARATLLTLTASLLQQREFPPLRYAVDGLICEGLTILAGSPKVGKSWLALDLALAVASGGLALSAIPVEQRDVLFLALEDGPRRLQDRIRSLHGDQAWPTGLHFAVSLPTAGHPDALLEAVNDHMEQHPETSLVVIDTLAKIRPRARHGDSTSAYDVDYQFAGRLQRWATDHRIAVVALHHDRKLASGDFVQSVSGTFGITGAADTVLLLTRNRGSDSGLLQLTGRDIPDDLAWELHRAGPAWILKDRVPADLAHASANLGDIQTQIVRIVLASPHPIGPSDIAAQVGQDRGLVDTYLARLLNAGRITRPSRGKYHGLSTPLSEEKELSDQSHPNSHTPHTTDISTGETP